MYQPLSNQLLRVMTGADESRIPSLATILRLPAIHMRLAEQYNRGSIRTNALKILQNSALPSMRSDVGFKRDLPDVITGQNQNWRLWRVDFYVTRLQLYYVDTALNNDTRCHPDASPTEPAGPRGCGCAFLVSPTSIGMDFEAPDMNWQINCEMSSSSPTGSHTIKLSEAKDGELIGAFTYTVPSVDEFTPPEIQV